MTVEQSQLVNEHRPKSEASGADPAFGGDLLVYIEDTLEVLIEVLVGQATQLVKDPPHLHPGLGVRVGSTLGGDQKPLRPLAFVAYVCSIVMGVSQNEARLFRQLLDQERSYLVVRHLGRGKPRREWNPHPAHRDGQVQLPPIHPSVPARFCPACLGVYGSMRHSANFFVFLVPHSAFGSTAVSKNLDPHGIIESMKAYS